MIEDDMIYFLNWLIDYCRDNKATRFEILSTILKESKIELKEIEEEKRKREEARRERERRRLIF